MHNRTNYLTLWAPHGEYGWYIGPAMEHYSCLKAYIPKTRVERISDTVEFSPKTFHMPQISSMDATYHAAQDRIYSLQNQVPTIPLVKLGNVHKESLKTLADIFRKAKPPAVPPRGASQGGRPKETPSSEAGRNTYENVTTIQDNHQCRTYEGAYCRGIPR